MKTKRFVASCLFALLGYELAILLYVLSFPNIYDLWWVVYLGNWARIFLPYVPKVLKEFSLLDVIMPCTMISTVVVLFNFNSFKIVLTYPIDILALSFITSPRLPVKIIFPLPL